MSNGIGAFGAEIKLWNGSTYTTIGGLKDISGVGFSVGMSDTTAHDSAGGFGQAVPSGRKTFKDVTIDLIWEPATDTTHTDLLNEFLDPSENPLQFQIAFNSGEEITWTGRVMDIEYTNGSGETDSVMAKIVIRPTGAPTM